jgi:hypothetical protein
MSEFNDYEWSYWWPRIVAECDSFEEQLERARSNSLQRMTNLLIIACGLLMLYGVTKRYERETLSKSLDNSRKDEACRDYRLNQPDRTRHSYPRWSGGGGVPYT